MIWRAIAGSQTAEKSGVICVSPLSMTVCVQAGTIGVVSDWWAFMAAMAVMLVAGGLIGWLLRAQVRGGP